MVKKFESFLVTEITKHIGVCRNKKHYKHVRVVLQKKKQPCLHLLKHKGVKCCTVASCLGGAAGWYGKGNTALASNGKPDVRLASLSAPPL